MSVRYYHYISDTKVDMLLSQVDPAVAHDERNQVARLERVLRHLDDHDEVGTVAAPGRYFRGVLPMQWGPMATPSGKGLIYFGGRTDDTIVGLGGSAGQLVGANAAPDQYFRNSLLPILLRGLAEADKPDVEPDAEQFDQADARALGLVRHANGRLRGPTENLEFVAKRLLHGPSPYVQFDRDVTVLLGSPLYVAQTD